MAHGLCIAVGRARRELEALRRGFGARYSRRIIEVPVPPGTARVVVVLEGDGLVPDADS